MQAPRLLLQKSNVNAAFEEVWEYHGLVARYNAKGPAMDAALHALLKSLFPGASLDRVRSASDEIGKFIDQMWTGLIGLDLDDSRSVADSGVAEMN